MECIATPGRSYHSPMRLILASASPRRAELLTAAGFAFEVCTTDVDESIVAGETPHEYVHRLAVSKSARARELVRAGTPADDVVVIGADTAVIVDDEILGKPADAADARRMIRLLSGRAHVVLTGVSVRAGAVEVAAVDQTCVHVAALSDAQVDWYVDSGEGLDKAGAYAIQGLASRFITRIEGSYSNVVGLPVAVIDRLMGELTARNHTLASGG
jgi:septum formation protein